MPRPDRPTPTPTLEVPRVRPGAGCAAGQAHRDPTPTTPLSPAPGEAVKLTGGNVHGHPNFKSRFFIFHFFRIANPFPRKSCGFLWSNGDDLR